MHKSCYLSLSYSTVVLYIGINKVWGFLPKNPTYKSTKYLLSNSIAALVRHSQAQKCNKYKVFEGCIYWFASGVGTDLQC